MKKSEDDGPHKESQTSPVPGQLAYPGPVSERSTSEHSDLTQSLRWIINQQKSELKLTQVFSFVGYEYHLDSALVKTYSREMAQTSGFDPMLKVKMCFDCKMFDVTNWVARLSGVDGPRDFT